jgi:beta-lactamase class D
MRKYYPLLFLSLFLACSREEPKQSANQENTDIPKQIEVPGFQSILDSAKVIGTILIYDDSKNTYYANDLQQIFKGHLPASTFKIPNSLIALELGIVSDDSTLFKWDGQKRRSKTWEQDLIFREAFQLSCVPCYQEVARKIGAARMNKYLTDFNYGDIEVDSSNIDMFWLEGNSRISPFQQIDFLKRFYEDGLPITNRTQQIMKRIMKIEDNIAYKLSGKTGWSTSKEQDNGWFVGYLESEAGIFYFATNISPTAELDMKYFPAIRKEVTYAAFRQLDIIP